MLEELEDEVWAGLGDRRERLAALRAQDPDACEVIDRERELDFVWASNALDGNALSREEVERLLETGLAIGGKPLADHMEALDQNAAFDVAVRLAQLDQPIREAELLQLHAAVLARTKPESAGRFRERGRTVEGSLTTFPAPQEIEGLIGEFTVWLAAQPLDAKTAVAAHEWLVSIQPFEDGNGRTARLVMSLLLLRAGYPLLVVRAEDRAAYHAALEAVQLGGPSRPYEAFMTDRLEAAFAAYLVG